MKNMKKAILALIVVVVLGGCSTMQPTVGDIINTAAGAGHTGGQLLEEGAAVESKIKNREILGLKPEENQRVQESIIRYSLNAVLNAAKANKERSEELLLREQ